MSCENRQIECPNCQANPEHVKEGYIECYRNACSSCLVVNLDQDGDWGRWCPQCEKALGQAKNVTSELIKAIMGDSAWGR